MENNEILNYTLEHFKSGIMPLRLEPHDEPRWDSGLEMGIIITQKEFDNICARQTEIMDSVNAHFLDGLKVAFNERLKLTELKEKFIKEERNRVEKFLTDKDHKNAFQFPIKDGVFYLGYFKHVQNENPFPELYQKHIVYGHPIARLIREKDFKFDSITYPIAVKVIFEYSKYIDMIEGGSTSKGGVPELINILKGNNVKGDKIMKDADFDYLLEKVTEMLEKDALPNIDRQIPQIEFPKGHLQYLFYRIHIDKFGNNRIKSYFFTFLSNIFQQFSNSKTETMRKKFSSKPGTWDNDLKHILGEK